MSRPELRNRVAIVSGGGKGLGRSFSLDLAAHGAKVLVNNRNREIDEHGRGPADHVVSEILAAGGEAIADYHDAADPTSGAAMVDAAMQQWGRVDICVVNAGVGTGGMFHKETDDAFETLLAINLLGAARLARAAMIVMRKAEYGRLVLVASTGGLHADIGLSAYATSKGGMIALGRSLAAEGTRRGVFTNLLLPYATTQMTESGMADEYAEVATPERVAPVLTSLVDENCTLNGQLIVTGAGRLRSASVVEWGTVLLPDSLGPQELEELVQRSKKGQPKEFSGANEAFLDFMSEAAK
ncbi:MAG: SDR family NAD(P)-dependent oxidoreductase [Acidimicrobiales bacterium]